MSKLPSSEVRGLRRAHRAARRGLVIISLAVVLGLMVAASAAAIGTPLEKVSAPVKEVVETVTGPVQTSPPVSLPTPAPVKAPVQTPTMPPVSVQIPATPPVKVPIVTVDPPSASAPGVKISTPSGSAVIQPTNEAVKQSLTTVTGGASGGSGQAVSGSGAGAGVVAPVIDEGHLRGVPQSSGNGDVAGQTAALVAPIRQILAYVWPAIALARPGFATVLVGWARSAASFLAANETVLGAGDDRLVGGGHPKISNGIADWLKAPLRGFVSPFTPDTPLPPLFILIVGALGAIAIWYAFRKELGLPPFSRPRRRI